MTSRQIERKWLNTAEASAYTGIPASSLRKYRYEGRGPVYTKPAGRALYNISDLDAFMASGRRVPVSVRASKDQDRHVSL
jgi:predicted site-specific integrase-resolvase